MTTSDKTKQKLVDSMRKTKAGSAKKQALKQAAGKKKITEKNQVQSKPEHRLAQQQDGYQSARRVWPD